MIRGMRDCSGLKAVIVMSELKHQVKSVWNQNQNYYFLRVSLFILFSTQRSENNMRTKNTLSEKIHACLVLFAIVLMLRTKLSHHPSPSS